MIFGIQVGKPIEMSPGELKDSKRGGGSFIRRNADKPSDVQSVQVSITPITHTVWRVQGVSDFSNKQEADTFVAKYERILAKVGPEFTLQQSASSDIPVRLTSEEWHLSMRVTDLKKSFDKRGGYVVAIEMTRDGLFSLFGTELKETLDRAQPRSFDEARNRGELKGLR